MKKGIIISILCVLIVAIIVFAITTKINNNSNINQPVLEEAKEISKEDINKIEEIKNEINATANTDMYQLDEEYDGRKIIQIKTDIQYDTVLAGIIKNDMPKEEEIKQLLKNRPNKSGIWISESSREKFLKLLNDNNIKDYMINKEGYLEQNSGNSDKINNLIKTNKLFIIDISGKCYQRDEISGKIIEYPFEEMEPAQSVETYSIEDSTIISVTNNLKKILTNKQILEDILVNME